jgi:hypothetical protein
MANNEKMPVMANGDSGLSPPPPPPGPPPTQSPQPQHQRLARLKQQRELTDFFICRGMRPTFLRFMHFLIRACVILTT